VGVCPYDVFEIRPIAPHDRSGMSFAGRLTAFFHGNRQAYVVRPDDCHACQLCVEACPEKALKLTVFGG